MSHLFIHSLGQRLAYIEKNISDIGNILEFNKDISIRNNLILPNTSPNKILMTNEHNRVISCDINSIIKEEVMKNKTSLFDNIQIINNAGNCLSLGQSDKNLLKFSVDSDNTLNISSSISNDLDIFTKKINLLSNADSTNINSGSLIVYGGASVMKKLRVGDGIYLGTAVGEQFKLNCFEGGSIDIVWSGIWSQNIPTTITYQLIGRSVTLNMHSLTEESMMLDIIQNTPDSLLPKKLCPIKTISFPIFVIDDNVEKYGKIIIHPDGKINICCNLNDTFSGHGISGFSEINIFFIV